MEQAHTVKHMPAKYYPIRRTSTKLIIAKGDLGL